MGDEATIDEILNDVDTDRVIIFYLNLIIPHIMAFHYLLSRIMSMLTSIIS